MVSQRVFQIGIAAFLDGITGAALFSKVQIPGAPKVLVDTRSPEEVYPEYDALLKTVHRSA
jgi:hypothetical protein